MKKSFFIMAIILFSSVIGGYAASCYVEVSCPPGGAVSHIVSRCIESGGCAQPGSCHCYKDGYCVTVDFLCNGDFVGPLTTCCDVNPNLRSQSGPERGMIRWVIVFNNGGRIIVKRPRAWVQKDTEKFEPLKLFSEEGEWGKRIIAIDKNGKPLLAITANEMTD